MRLPDVEACITDITKAGETAAAIATVDLVATVDSSVAHLAGAMGVPSWVPVHHLDDWRWLLNREDSP